jgi:hypothetical protein
MYLVEMTLAGWLRQERPDAFVQSATDDKVGTRGRLCALIAN